jgi:Protein of unknown function (DUF3095)
MPIQWLEMPVAPPNPSDDFFKKLPLLKHYRDVTQAENFRPAPHDWHVVITDVVNSRIAIEAGDYKNVNILGAMTIIGLLNVAGEIDFPFVFGGDGASCLLPPSLLPVARNVLLVAKNRAREAFGLTLRVGIVPIERLIADGFSIRVAKLAVSKHFSQAVFAGGGIARAEQLVKSTFAAESWELPDDPSAIDADFSGLECRWNPVRSDKGEVVSLLIQARGKDDQKKSEVYEQVIARIEAVFGHTGDYHPATETEMFLATDKKSCAGELRAKFHGRSPWARWFHLQLMLFQSRMGNRLLGRPFRFAGVDWRNYKKILIENTDYQKFDDMIRMVISCSRSSREKFENYLNEQRALGKLVYGLHVTDHALLTCLVFDRFDRHFHFVDGSNGGYALAADALKEQTRSLEE